MLVFRSEEALQKGFLSPLVWAPTKLSWHHSKSPSTLGAYSSEPFKKGPYWGPIGNPWKLLSPMRPHKSVVPWRDVRARVLRLIKQAWPSSVLGFLAL